MQHVVDTSEISFRVGFTMTRLLGRATCASVGQGHMLSVVEGPEITLRVGFTMTRLLGRATFCLLLTGTKFICYSLLVPFLCVLSDHHTDTSQARHKHLTDTSQTPHIHVMVNPRPKSFS